MKKIILFTLLALLANACLEYKEKLKINDDGSGEIKFAIGINISLFDGNKTSDDLKEFDESKIKEKYTGKKGIKCTGSRSYTEAGSKWIEITLEFDSLEDLVSASKDSSNLGMIGQINLKEDRNGNMVFEREISSSQKDSTNNILNAMFSNYKWIYELTVPGKIISTNASENDIDKKTNTVKWYYNLASVNNSSTMIVVYQKNSSTNYILLIFLVIGAIMLAFVLLYLLKLKKDDEVRVK